ncbi:MAG: hypothetical protein QM768_02805 [Agriterribacter sp.]
MELKKYKKENRHYYKLLYNNRIIAYKGIQDRRGAYHFENPEVIDKETIYNLKKSKALSPISLVLYDTDILSELNICLFSLTISKNIEFNFSIFACDILNKYKVLPHQYLKSIMEQIEKSENFRIDENNNSLNYSGYPEDLNNMILCFKYSFSSDNIFQEELIKIKSRLKKIINNAKLTINGFTWKQYYETNELAFTNKVLLPLFRKMKFHNIKFNHGVNEFGRDIVFTETNLFGGVYYYGVQVKAGNISGKINSEIDKIIGQIEDAFKLPYNPIESKSEQYISILIIACSGYFSENAKHKILHKTPKGLTGSILFFDRDKILELVSKFW